MFSVFVALIRISLSFHSILRILLFCFLQVDVLKSTAVPLMKKFGIDGEGFDLKARTR